MIPLKLALRNFMCYREPDTLDFSGLHLVCLTGNNGHGKSALLDAITWAVWGRARSNQADDLIHLGQEEMWVDFQFALANNRYRVLRSRQRRGRSGKSDLQLQIWDEGEGEYRPITEPTIRDTEQRIVQLLRMDYDTFVNSAFLVQGRADEFTVKPPNQRKQILADILGLGQYDQYEAKAREMARQRREEAGQVEAQIGAIDQELAREGQYREDLRLAQAQVLQLSEQLRTAEEQLRSQRLQRQELLSHQRALEDLQVRMQRGERELVEVSEHLTRDRARLTADQTVLEQQAEVEAGYRALQEARQADLRWNQKLGQQAELQTRRGQHVQALSLARNRLETERQLADERVGRLRGQAERAGMAQHSLAEAQDALAELAQLEQQQAVRRADIQALKEEAASLRAQNQRLKEEMEEVKERLDLLAQAEADCPVCGRPLGSAERERVIRDYQERGQAMGDSFRAATARLREVSQQGTAAEQALQELTRTLAARSRWQRQEAQAEAQLAEAGEAQAALTTAVSRLEELSTQLAAGQYGEEQQALLAEVEGELAALGYDPHAHAAAREVLLHSEHFQERHSQLRSTLERQQHLQANIERLQAGRERWLEVLQADRQRRQELEEAVAGLAQVELDLRSRSTEVAQLELVEQRARQHLGAAQQRLDACQAQAERRQGLSTQWETLRAQQALYEDLQAAFGKKGLQAMIIESAIPEIESEANQLLNRMTDGRMSVRMETQRETKTTQELRETLDIILSDELGSRDYSLFSGGEAFRANLAIRIALSKLLARRAGARLQTLIVDEGFGTQDAQGRERLVQAITSIQDDFERILVITHIDELKDHFPARIDVVKTAEGSQISVN